MLQQLVDDGADPRLVHSVCLPRPATVLPGTTKRTQRPTGDLAEPAIVGEVGQGVQRPGRVLVALERTTKLLADGGDIDATVVVKLVHAP